MISGQYAKHVRLGIYFIGFILSFPLAAQLLDAGKMALADSDPIVAEKYDAAISNVVKQRDGATYTFIGSVWLDKALAANAVFVLLLSIMMLYFFIAITLKHLLLDPIKFTSNFVDPALRWQTSL